MGVDAGAAQANAYLAGRNGVSHLCVSGSLGAWLGES